MLKAAEDTFRREHSDQPPLMEPAEAVVVAGLVGVFAPAAAAAIPTPLTADPATSTTAASRRPRLILMADLLPLLPEVSGPTAISILVR